MTIRGAVVMNGDLCTGCGERWLDDEAVPDLPLVAYEFNSGIERATAPHDLQLCPHRLADEGVDVIEPGEV